MLCGVDGHSAHSLTDFIFKFIFWFLNYVWRGIINNYLVSIFLFRFCVSPYTVFKKLGIPGPTPLPFFGNSASSLFCVSCCVFCWTLCPYVIVCYNIIDCIAKVKGGGELVGKCCLMFCFVFQLLCRLVVIYVYMYTPKGWGIPLVPSIISANHNLIELSSSRYIYGYHLPPSPPPYAGRWSKEIQRGRGAQKQKSLTNRLYITMLKRNFQRGKETSHWGVEFFLEQHIAYIIDTFSLNSQIKFHNVIWSGIRSMARSLGMCVLKCSISDWLNALQNSLTWWDLQ